MDELTISAFIELKGRAAALLISFVADSLIPCLYPDADITIKIRKGHVLPAIDISDHVNCKPAEAARGA